VSGVFTVGERRGNKDKIGFDGERKNKEICGGSNNC
jgi:hypothetical protein